MFWLKQCCEKGQAEGWRVDSGELQEPDGYAPQGEGRKRAVNAESGLRVVLVRTRSSKTLTLREAVLAVA